MNVLILTNPASSGLILASHSHNPLSYISYMLLSTQYREGTFFIVEALVLFSLGYDGM